MIHAGLPRRYHAFGIDHSLPRYILVVEEVIPVIGECGEVLEADADLPSTVESAAMRCLSDTTHRGHSAGTKTSQQAIDDSGLVVLTAAEKTCNMPVTCNPTRGNLLNGFVDGVEPPLCLVRSSHA